MPNRRAMCIKYVRKYIQCRHSGVIWERCEIYRANQHLCHEVDERKERVNGLCPGKCGGGPKQEAVIYYPDPATISSWTTRESGTSIDTTSSLDSGVELLRRGSQKAVGGVKRFIGSIRSDRSNRSIRSSESSPVPPDTVLETESASRGKDSLPCFQTLTNEPLANGKTVNTLRPRARNLQRATEDSLGATRLNSIATGSMTVIRPTPGRDIEIATVSTTWSELISQARRAVEPKPVEGWPTRSSQRVIEDSSDPVAVNTEVISGMNDPRPSLGRDIEPASISTTWRKVSSQARGDAKGENSEISQSDRVLFGRKFEVSQNDQDMDRKRQEELAKAAARLARVRDGRGYINFDV